MDFGQKSESILEFWKAIYKIQEEDKAHINVNKEHLRNHIQHCIR